MLDWSFTYLKIIKDGDPQILFSCTYRDGEKQLLATPEKTPDVIQQLKPVMTLLTYIAFFPNKDFTKIKLDTPSNHFAIHYLDKRQLDKDFLGIFSVSEYQTETIFEYWGVEEMLAEFAFDYYHDNSVSNQNFDENYDWLSIEIKNFYMDWKEGKQKHFSGNQNVKTLRNIPDEEKIFEQWWDLQLINEYGAPLTDMISFIDDNAFFLTSENEVISQSLESMSISALKILIDQHAGWNIRYLKNHLNNNMGFSYTFFEKFTIKDVRYLLLMNSSLYHIEKEECIQMFRGNEFSILRSLADKLATHTLFFTEEGQIEASHKPEIHKIILDYIREAYE
jgi:hypothetical protein